MIYNIHTYLEITDILLQLSRDTNVVVYNVITVLYNYKVRKLSGYYI